MANRFFRRGKTQVHYVLTIAVQAVPTLLEIQAGTELTADVMDVEGFSFANQPIETPDYANAFVSKIPGADQAADSALVIHEYEGQADNPLRTTLAKGTKGFIVISPGPGTGVASVLAVGDLVDVWPIEVAGKPRVFDSGNTGATWRSEITLTGAPSEDVALA